jgi:D-alanine--poly(phosphoribitol) ligase subunit 2
MSLPTAEIVLTELEHITGTDQVKKDLDLSLFDESILDSLGTVELMVALSENFRIDISPAEIDRAMWSTPRKIISYIENKINEG